MSPTTTLEEEVEVAGLWVRFKETGDQDARDRLIRKYSPLVRFVAGRVGAGLPPYVDRGDLVGWGYFGLMDAVEKFDLEQEVRFETYAVTRIKGSIIDGMRQFDPVPRSVRLKVKQLERAMAKLEAILDRAPTDSELAEELEITEAQLRKVFILVASLGSASLDEVMTTEFSGDLSHRGDFLTDDRDLAEAGFERSENRQMLAQVINRLSDSEKVVLTFYYFEQYTLKEIGAILGITESRVCQIHGKALVTLKTWLSKMAR